MKEQHSLQRRKWERYTSRTSTPSVSHDLLLCSTVASNLVNQVKAI